MIPSVVARFGFVFWFNLKTSPRITGVEKTVGPICGTHDDENDGGDNTINRTQLLVEIERDKERERSKQLLIPTRSLVQ